MAAAPHVCEAFDERCDAVSELSPSASPQMSCASDRESVSENSPARARVASGIAVCLALGAWMGLPATRALAGADGPSASASSVTRMDELWAHRDRPFALQELVALGTAGLATDPGNYELQWRVGRAYFWVAYTQSNRVAKRALAEQAMAWAERARAAEPDRVEGHYVYAVACGAYASAIDLLQAAAAGIAGKLEAAALRAYAINPDYEDGAPGTVLGRYYFQLPWPMRDLNRSRRYLEEVVARHPHKLTARDYLADTYYALGERERARAQLRFVLDSEIPPGSELDVPPPKALAAEALRRWFGETPLGRAIPTP